MRRIIKQHSVDLTDFIEKEKAKGEYPSYKELSKNPEYTSHFFNIRQQLLKEQGYICCYCQQLISFVETQSPNMRVEHFKPKNNKDFKELEVDYLNLLAACLGYTKEETHCDQRKLGKELKDIPNPASEAFDTFKIRYFAPSLGGVNTLESDAVVKVVPLWDEEIKTVEKEHDRKLKQRQDPLTGKAKEGCLNLNHPELQQNRLRAWYLIRNKLLKTYGKKNPAEFVKWKRTEEGIQFAREQISLYEKTNNEGQLIEFCQVMIDLLKKEFKMSE
jgi:uncharacterized protein (TIGR02646 family)